MVSGWLSIHGARIGYCPGQALDSACSRLTVYFPGPASGCCGYFGLPDFTVWLNYLYSVETTYRRQDLLVRRLAGRAGRLTYLMHELDRS